MAPWIFVHFVFNISNMLGHCQVQIGAMEIANSKIGNPTNAPGHYQVHGVISLWDTDDFFLDYINTFIAKTTKIVRVQGRIFFEWSHGCEILRVKERKFGSPKNSEIAKIRKSQNFPLIMTKGSPPLEIRNVLIF